MLFMDHSLLDLDLDLARIGWRDLLIGLLELFVQLSGLGILLLLVLLDTFFESLEQLVLSVLWSAPVVVCRVQSAWLRPGLKLMTGTFSSAWPRLFLWLLSRFSSGHTDQSKQAGAEEPEGRRDGCG